MECFFLSKLGNFLGAGGLLLTVGASYVFIYHSFTMSEKRQMIEKKAKKFAQKHKAFLFLIFRVVLYIWIANGTVRIQYAQEYSEVYLFEAINYLVILAIIFLFPTLEDFENIGNHLEGINHYIERE